jgi:hypothetical protein
MMSAAYQTSLHPTSALRAILFAKVPNTPTGTPAVRNDVEKIMISL